ncbi:MAG: T9SS type A sorting domain-containing protein [Balneolales bacterium]|nr:T9SS type A sorting domain-containing protein [Balneolales bacterium]
MRNNGFSNVTAAITYSGSSPVINRCDFIDNVRSAIGSGANVTGAPQITNSRFLRNVTDNTNRPQINLGPGIAGDTLRIENNIIEGFNNNSGGIGLSNLLGGGVTVASIRNNVITGNRFGITQIGNNISTVIEGNIISDNNIQNNPMLGGSGLNFLAMEPTNTSRVRRNIISGNLWGVTTQLGSAQAVQGPQPDFGTAEDPGGNVFFGNGNNNALFALYNNTMMELTAIGNYWGDNSAEFAESVIFHQPDDASLGLVVFEPILELQPEFGFFAFFAHDNPGLTEDVIAEIDPETATITAVLPIGTSLSALIPSVAVPLGVEGAPEAGQSFNFSEPVSFTLSTPHGEEQSWTADITTASATVFLQFAHFSADPALETVALFVDDELIEENFSYQTATDYFEFNAASTEITIELREGESILFSESLPLEQFGFDGTIVFTGVADPDAFDPNPDGTDISLRAVVFRRDIIPVNEYWAEYRILHAVTNAPAVSLVAQPGDLTLGFAAYAEEAEFSIPIFEELEADLLELRTADGETSIAVYNLITEELPANFFFVISGFADNPELGILDAETGTFTPLMRATNLPGIEQPHTFTLEQNYPNPFNPATNIRFSLAESGDAVLTVYNIQGQLVATLVNGSLPAGQHTVRFDASALASGLYLTRLRAGNETQLIKMMLVK